VRNHQQIGWDFSFLLWYIVHRSGSPAATTLRFLPEGFQATKNKRQTNTNKVVVKTVA